MSEQLFKMIYLCTSVFATIQLFRLLHSAGTSPRAHQPLL